MAHVQEEMKGGLRSALNCDLNKEKGVVVLGMFEMMSQCIMIMDPLALQEALNSASLRTSDFVNQRSTV